MKRKHLSSKQQQDILSQWRGSGLSADQFAAQHGLSRGSLGRWKKRWQETQVPPAFRPVTMRLIDEPIGPAQQAERPVAELVSGAMTARVYAGMKHGDLHALVMAMRGGVSC